MSYRIIKCEETKEYRAEVQSHYNVVYEVGVDMGIIDWVSIGDWHSVMDWAKEDIYIHKTRSKVKRAREKAINNPVVIEVIE